jgi:hypothetical protein
MNKKQRATYEALFKTPIRRNIVWDDVLSLKELKRYQVKDVRTFLLKAGVEK